MRFDITTSPVFVMTCLRSISLKNFKAPESIHAVGESYIGNYLSSAYHKTAKELVDSYTKDPNNRLEPVADDFYIHDTKGDFPELMSVLFAASKNKNSLKQMEKYFSIADALPFEFALFCLHMLLIKAYKDEDIQRSIPDQLYAINNIQALRFLDRVVTVSRLNLFVSISTIKIPDSVHRAWNAA